MEDMNQRQNATKDSRRTTTNMYDYYVAAVAEIVLKVHRLSSFQSMLPVVRDKTVMDWMEILWGRVPLEGLRSSYEIAMSKHKDGPFRPGHIIAEWESARASLPVIQTECLFCTRLMEDPSAPESCRKDTSVPETCPFHSTRQQEVTH